MDLTISKLPAKALITVSCVLLLSACSESQAPSADIEVSVKAEVVEKVDSNVVKLVETPAVVAAVTSEKEVKKTIAENVDEAKTVLVESSVKVTEITKDAAAKVLTNGKAIASELSESAAQKIEDSTGTMKETFQKAAVVSDEVTKKLSGNLEKVMENTAVVKGKALVEQGAQTAKEVGKEALDQVKSLLPAN
ncbi:MAG: hypothetical protein V7784_04095 [Oceanospirillaceae bacterium]